MADLEKVIRGWERCRKCHDVPILFSESYRDCEYTRGMYCRQDILIEDTLALLKEQEAVKPTWSRGKPFCGACGLRILGDKFCSECGKPIAWEGR